MELSQHSNSRPPVCGRFAFLGANMNVEPANRTETGQFAPGFSGNPNGRPKSKPITDAIREVLREMAINGEVDKLRTMVRAVVDKAIEGDVPAFREVTDRIEGKSPQAVEHSGPDGEPLLAESDPRQLARAILALLATGAKDE